MPGDCQYAYMAVGFTSFGLLISVCLNITFYLLRRKERKYSVNENQSDCGDEPFRRDSPQSYRYEDDEMERQENPIYGNICIEGGAFEMSPEVCYEQMSQASTIKHGLKVSQVHQGDVSYASLDLTSNKKRKKKRKYHKQAQTHQAQTHIQPQQNCLDQDTETEAVLPSRSSSLMISRHSIYLNSHQVALEAEERERERERELEMEREREDHLEREFEMERHLHDDYDQSLNRSRQSLEQDSQLFES